MDTGYKRGNSPYAFSTGSSCSCFSCSPTHPSHSSSATTSLPLLTAAPKSSPEFTPAQSLLLHPCLRISFHDKPALFRASCHCTASATRQPVLTGSGAPRHWGELVPAPPAPIPSIPPRPNSPLVVCAGHHCTAGREATQLYVLRGTRAALQRKPTSAPPCVSRNS